MQWSRICAVSLLVACQQDSRDLEVKPRGDEPETQVPETQLARLTDSQYRTIVRDVFGSGIALPTNLDPVDEVNGFESVGASYSSISALGVERFEAAAFQVAEQVLADTNSRAEVLNCESGPPESSACREEVFSRLGRIPLATPPRS